MVPPGDPADWSGEPFAAQSSRASFGRGASDMKGAIAAFVAAAGRLSASDAAGEFGGSISLLITGDEEGALGQRHAQGARLDAQEGRGIDACLVGEPTNPEALGDMVKIGRRGRLTGRLDRVRQAGPHGLSAAGRQRRARLVAMLRP